MQLLALSADLFYFKSKHCLVIRDLTGLKICSYLPCPQIYFYFKSEHCLMIRVRSILKIYSYLPCPQIYVYFKSKHRLVIKVRVSPEKRSHRFCLQFSPRAEPQLPIPTTARCSDNLIPLSRAGVIITITINGN